MTLQSKIVFRGDDGIEISGSLSRLTRHGAVFEIPDPHALTGLRVSEVLPEFKVIQGDRTLYSGRAVLRSQINSGSVLICESTLDEVSWTDLDFASVEARPGKWGAEYNAFLDEWQKLYRIDREYKLVIADMHSFFSGLRFWLARVELGISSAPEIDRAARGREVADQLAEKIIPSMNELFDKFEDVAIRLEPNRRATHQNYMRQQLHSLVLAAPFAHRTFTKPLGYAGDYEMVNMILRNAPEGSTLFGKLLHAWFVRQQPAEAHRNRIDYLITKITEMTLKASAAGRTAKIFNMACGPASEVQRFISESALRSRTEFTLLDFNEETLKYTRQCIATSAVGVGPMPPVQYIKKSVHHLLKESVKKSSTPGEARYDLVYCAGLFDYLSDEVCSRLMGLMYDWVRPGGLLIATNVESNNPRRHGMDHLLDWPLIYRTAADMAKISPKTAHRDDVRSYSDDTGVNVFLEVTKPTHG